MKTFVFKRLAIINYLGIINRYSKAFDVVFDYSLTLALQDLLKDFLDKKGKGELMIQKASNLLHTILKEVLVCVCACVRVSLLRHLNVSLKYFMST